ncbi:hypothetical protein C8J56DRAFT_384190 [Mycena floridula]|nr:hypothetical protein C8J56DRAFT_384190 [Mycena floridula]
MEAKNATEPFPELPLELVLVIIEKLLEIQPRRAMELMTLSRHFLPIAEKTLYHSIVIKSKAATDLFVEMLKSGRRPKTFYQNHVKTFCLVGSLSILRTMHEIFSTCTGVHSIGILNWQDGPPVDGFLDALSVSGPRPSRFGMACTFMWADRLSLPLFENLTHLEFRLDDVVFLFFDTTCLHSLAKLTHLCLVGFFRSDLAIYIPRFVQDLVLADSIVVCILYQSFDNPTSVEQFRLLLARDPRFVFARKPHESDLKESSPEIGRALLRDLTTTDHFLRRWGTGPDEEELDIWEEAEEIVRAQRSKLV